jgi:hypothetical protein
MPTTDKRLDDAIRTALNGGGRQTLHEVIASLWHDMSERTRRALDVDAGAAPAGGHIKVVNL